MGGGLSCACEITHVHTHVHTHMRAYAQDIFRKVNRTLFPPDKRAASMLACFQEETAPLVFFALPLFPELAGLQTLHILVQNQT